MSVRESVSDWWRRAYALPSDRSHKLTARHSAHGMTACAAYPSHRILVLAHHSAIARPLNVEKLLELARVLA